MPNINIYLNEELNKKVDKLAKQNGIGKSDQIIRLISGGVINEK